MAGKRSRLSQAPDTSTSSPWKRWALVAFVVAEVLFIGYLIAEAFQADAEWRPWYLVASGGLSLMVGVIVWSRVRRNSSGSV